MPGACNGDKTKVHANLSYRRHCGREPANQSLAGCGKWRRDLERDSSFPRMGSSYQFALWKWDPFLVRGSSRSATCLGQEDRLVKAALGCQNPAAADESGGLEDATEFLPQNGTIV